MTAPLKCPRCPGHMDRGQQVCPTCWSVLPAATRTRLGRRDDRADVRLRQFRKALAAKTPLAIIRVSP